MSQSRFRSARGPFVVAALSVVAAMATVVMVQTTTAAAAADYAGDCQGVATDIHVAATAPATVAPGASIGLTGVAVDITTSDATAWGVDAIQSGFMKLVGIDDPVVLGALPLDASAAAISWALPTAEVTAPATPGTLDLRVEYIDFAAAAFGTSFTIRCTPAAPPAPSFATVAVAEQPTTTLPPAGGTIDVTSPITGSMTIGGVKGAVGGGAVFNGKLEEASGALTGTMSFPRSVTTNTVGGLVATTDQQVIQVGSGSGLLKSDGTATWNATYAIRMNSLQLGSGAPTVFPATCVLSGIKVKLKGSYDPATKAIDIQQKNFEIPHLASADACGSYTNTFNSTIAGYNTEAHFLMVLKEGTTAPPTTVPGTTPPTTAPGSPTPPGGAAPARAIRGSVSFTG